MTERHDHAWTHEHVYLGVGHARAERRTRIVVVLNTAFMVVEIAAGILFGSMALLADGVHMATHVGALGIAAWAYFLARRHAANRRFSFGSGKFGDLAAFSNALILAIAALAVAAESFLRFYTPVAINYRDAIVVAGLGLAVNLVSALVLQERSEPAAEHDAHGHAHDEQHHDYNLRAAYLHIVADAATSVLALVALTLGALYGWSELDPLVGVIGAIVIGSWSVQLLRQSGLVLLDVEDDPRLSEAIKRTLESELKLHIADLHLWRLGPGHRGLIVSLISPVACSADDIKHVLRLRHAGLSHVTVEVAVCQSCAPNPQ
jgi:cation diffusion facilitator family transporter